MIIFKFSIQSSKYWQTATVNNLLTIPRQQVAEINTSSNCNTIEVYQVCRERETKLCLLTYHSLFTVVVLFVLNCRATWTCNMPTCFIYLYDHSSKESVYISWMSRTGAERNHKNRITKKVMGTGTMFLTYFYLMGIIFSLTSQKILAPSLVTTRLLVFDAWQDGEYVETLMWPIQHQVG